jgi:TetR/AcrR family transcriptional regulator, cholesterol catabolism regulator
VATKAMKQQVPKEEDLSAAKDSVLIHMKQKQIVEGAFSLFLQKGFHDTSTREIAEVCGISKGQLYHYIKSKEDIIFLTYSYVRDLWVKKFQASRMDSINDPFQKLVAALGLTMDFMMSSKRFVVFLDTQRTHLSAKKRETFLRQNDARTLQFWRGLLEQIEKDHPMTCDAEMGAKMIIQNIYFFLFNDIGRDKEAIANCRENVIHFILRGLGLKAPA